MKRGNPLPVILGVAITTILVLALWTFALGPADRGSPSTRERSGVGLRGAFLYLEARGVPTAIHDDPLRDGTLPAPDSLLVIAQPVSVMPERFGYDALVAWIKEGGHVLLLGSGEAPADPDHLLLQQLGLATIETREDPPLRFSAWRDWKTEESLLEPAETTRGLPSPLRVRVGRFEIQRPGGAEDLWIDEDGTPAIFAVPRGEGRVIVANNASLIGNTLLDQDENLALLEWLAREELPEGGSVLFADSLHGYGASGREATGRVVTAVETLLLHIFVIYAAAAWVLSRRFGPALVTAGPPSGSVERDLTVLAGLHQRSRHAYEAGLRLLDLAQGAARRRRLSIDGLPEEPGDRDADLLALARKIGTMQEDKKL